ncbi:hypothetical protein [Motiliproteus sp. MSK22-1]|uniref:HD domain-containing protein n=1 Tax=Motiliproteus sp. MSK22-1 TaxID=1897630 RepID=UPI000975BBC7|nr:hypothetical protein [Motiliproteus sp. MSK22-1]OMH39739.1 hypothetical protein BGP75_01370 [Motiliproteus sp. MSK22-1]
MDSSRFHQLWQRNVSGGNAWEPGRVFDYLADLYAEPIRNYHNSDHIELCLEWFDRYRDLTVDPDAIELAIWFHDACYGPEPIGHENRSAGLFRKLSADGISKDRQDKICQLIMDTTHQQPPSNDDASLLVDIDLASFARPWHPYLKDTARCRAERSHLDEGELCRCQIDFLQSLMSRPYIYYSQAFRLYHEDQARQNITKLIELLSLRTCS